MISFPAGMIFGLLLGGWVVYCVLDGERALTRRPPRRRRYYFRCVLAESECLPAVICGEVLAGSSAEAWSWVRKSIVMPGEWICELLDGRPEERTFVADIDNGELIVGQRADRRCESIGG